MIDFDDKNKEIISIFLWSEVSTFSESIIYYIDKVLNDESDYEEFNGNICGIEIHSDKTQIYNNLADDGEGNWCEIETKELRELIDVWLAKLNEFNSNSKNL